MFSGKNIDTAVGIREQDEVEQLRSPSVSLFSAIRRVTAMASTPTAPSIERSSYVAANGSALENEAGDRLSSVDVTVTAPPMSLAEVEVGAEDEDELQLRSPSISLFSAVRRVAAMASTPTVSSKERSSYVAACGSSLANETRDRPSSVDAIVTAPPMSLQEAAFLAVKSEHLLALKLLLGASAVDVNDPNVHQSYQAHSEELLRLGDEYLSTDSESTNNNIMQQYYYLNYDFIAIQQDLLGKLAVRLSLASVNEENTDVAAFFSELKNNFLESFDTETKKLLEEFSEKVGGLVKARDAIVVKEKRLSQKKLDKVTSIWLVAGDKLMHSNIDATKDRLALIEAELSITDSLRRIRQWQQDVQEEKVFLHGKIEGYYAKIDDLAVQLDELREVYSGPFRAGKDTYDQLRQFHQALGGCMGIFYSYYYGVVKELSLLFESENDLAVITARVPIDGLNAEGDTLLKTAIVHNRYKAAKMLLHLGANPFIADKDGFSAFYWACHAKNGKFLKLIHAAVLVNDAATEVDVNPLLQSIKENLLAYTQLYTKRLDSYSASCRWQMKHRAELLSQFWNYFMVANEVSDPAAMVDFMRQSNVDAPRGLVGRSQLLDNLLRVLPVIPNGYEATAEVLAVGDWQKTLLVKSHDRDKLARNQLRAAANRFAVEPLKPDRRIPSVSSQSVGLSSMGNRSLLDYNTEMNQSIDEMKRPSDMFHAPEGRCSMDGTVI